MGENEMRVPIYIYVLIFILMRGTSVHVLKKKA